MDKKNIECKSAILGEDLHVVAYGKKGLPVVVFPTQGQAPESIEEVGIVDDLAEYLDSGTIQLFCTETIDDESWGSDADPAERAQRQETYYHYVVDELVPLVNKVSGSKARPLTLGFDAGATQAAIVTLRRPDLFQGCMCLSGCYDARRYFGDWMDATLYDNTPCAFLPNMGPEHPYVEVYNKRQLLFCTGQDISEADSLRSTRELGEQFARLGVDVWCDYWGPDVTHTWQWWKKQLRYFLPIVLDDVEKTTAAEKPAPKKRAPRKKAATKATAAAKKPAAKAAEKPAAKPAEKPAEKPTAKAAAPKAAPKKAAAAKTAEKPAAKAAAPKSPAKVEKPAAPAKAEKPAAPAKAVKAEVPAKATKAAAPAKTAKAAAPAKAATEKPAAKAAPKAEPKPAAKPAAKTTVKPEPKPAAKAEPKPAAKPAAKKTTKTATKTAATKATTAKPATTKATAPKPAASKSPAAKPTATKTTTKFASKPAKGTSTK